MAGQAGYYIDIVMCIDATGDMRPIIEDLKKNARSLGQIFYSAIEDEYMKEVAQLRVKVITFRDYGCDDEPMTESQFFTLPDQNEAFSAFVSRLEAKCGGDEPENALEAIALALKSDWTTDGIKRRHIIAVLSDAPAHPLGKRADSPNYPENIPNNIAELLNWWEGTDQSFEGTYQPKAGRLIAFVPNEKPWTDLEEWARYYPTYVSAGTGLFDVDIQCIIDVIVGGI